MKIQANGKEAIEVFRLSDNYKRGIFIYLFLAIASGIVYYTFAPNIFILVNLGISIGAAIYLSICKNKLKKLQAKIDDCYIGIQGDYINCYQLFDGKYESIKFNINEVDKIMEVDEGVQIWLKDDAINSELIIDGQKTDRKIACVGFYGYSIEDFTKWYIDVRASVPENIQVYENNQNWNKHDERKDMINMLVPCALFVVTFILSQFV